MGDLVTMDCAQSCPLSIASRLRAMCIQCAMCIECACGPPLHRIVRARGSLNGRQCIEFEHCNGPIECIAYKRLTCTAAAKSRYRTSYSFRKGEPINTVPETRTSLPHKCRQNLDGKCNVLHGCCASLLSGTYSIILVYELAGGERRV